jgi:putative ABC transport system permease protein
MHQWLFRIQLRKLGRPRINLLFLIFGLVIGILSSGFIFNWVIHEAFRGKLYNGVHLVVSKPSEGVEFGETSPFPFPNYAAYSAVSEIESFCTVSRVGNASLAVGDEKVFVANGLAVTASFFDLFRVKVLQGMPMQSDSAKYIFLSEATANKIFGEHVAVGQPVSLRYYDKAEFVVAGIFANPPKNSLFIFDFLVPVSSGPRWPMMPHDFIKPQKGASISQVNKELQRIGKLSPYFGANGKMEFDTSSLPVEDIYLNSTFSTFAHGNRAQILVLFLAGMLITLITILNYVNLQTSEIISRTRELSLKRILGASKQAFFWDFLAASIVHLSAAIMLSAIVGYFVWPYVFSYLQLEYDVLPVPLAELFAVLALALTALVLVASVLLYAMVRNISPVKGMRKVLGGGIGVNVFKEKLALIQLSFSVLAIFSVLSLNKQFDLIKSRDPGFHVDGILKIQPIDKLFSSDSAHIQDIKLKYIDDQLSGESSILDFDRGDFPTSAFPFQWKMNENDASNISTLAVGSRFFDVFGIPMIDGEPVTTSGQTVVLNEAAVKSFGIKNPIGYKIFNSSWGEFRVIGVTKDFYFEGTHFGVKPLVIVCHPYADKPLICRVTQGREKQAISKITEAYRKIGNSSLDVVYFRQEYQKLFNSDQVTERVFFISSIVIAVLALFGVFSFSTIVLAEKRTEIGIRRTFGASVREVVKYFLTYFIKRVLIAALIGLIVGLIALDYWLPEFEQRITLGFELIAITVSLVLAQTVLTIIFQIIKAARENPVEILKQQS